MYICILSKNSFLIDILLHLPFCISFHLSLCQHHFPNNHGIINVIFLMNAYYCIDLQCVNILLILCNYFHTSAPSAWIHAH